MSKKLIGKIQEKTLGKHGIYIISDPEHSGAYIPWRAAVESSIFFAIVGAITSTIFFAIVGVITGIVLK